MNWPLVLTFCIVLPVLSTPFDDTPVDYLVPPPVAIQSRAVPGPPPNEEPSMFNRLTNWMFSFGRSYEPSRDHRIVASPSEKVTNYQKPAKPFHSEKATEDISCSPCNKIPWIPIIPKQVPKESHQNPPPMMYVSSTVPTSQVQESTAVSFIQEAPASFIPMPQQTHLTASSTTVRQDFGHLSFTTSQRPFRNDQFQGVTSPEYLPPRQLLPIENENRPFAPIPLPNLSMTPIPPLHEAKPFLYDPYRSAFVGMKFIPTFANGTKYIEGLDIRMPPDMTQYKASNVGSFQSSPNVGSFQNSPNVGSIQNSQNFGSIQGSPNLGSIQSSPNVGSSQNSPNTGSIQSSPNVEVIESFPVVEFQHTTIEDSYGEVIKTTTTARNIVQYTTATSRPTETSLLNIYRGHLNLSDGSTLMDRNRKTPLSVLDAPIIHFNKSETNVLPIIVTFQNETNHGQTNVPSNTPSKTPNSIINEKSQAVKPIRYIIPYTTQQKPSPFRAKNLRNNKEEDTATGFSEWAPQRTVDQEIHDTQESSIVTATVPTPSPSIKTTKYIAKFLASSIKELLNKEKIEMVATTEISTTDATTRFTEPTTEMVETTTAQLEVVTTSSTSSSTTKKSTTSTTKKSTTSTTAATTTETIEEETKKIEEIVPFDFTTFQDNINKWTEEQFGLTSEAATAAASTLQMLKYTKPIPVEYITESVLLPKITIATSKPSSTTPTPHTTPMNKHRVTYSDPFLDTSFIERLKSSFKQAKAYSSKTSYRNHAEQWNKVQVTISPLTKEKIYIVTPQSFASLEVESSEVVPRFKKRPTPGRGFNFS